MKRVLLLLTVLLLFVLCACDGGGEATTENTSVQTTVEKVTTTWDDVEYPDRKSMEQALGCTMRLPEYADDVRCVILREVLGHIEFKVDNCEYVYRCALKENNVEGSGLYGVAESRFLDDDVVKIIEGTEVTFRQTADGIELAVWQNDEANYSVAISADEDGSIEMLAEIVDDILN